ncbi:unnamed protein product [Miscanthus lutarioriparius]|uniref:Uncharacterized protein n=1 Tax=Miscanthus lutarioriparius TaxID=422564 RepID=A0A811Q8L0_9POAL|nr:unnamed protein product [Miscanthus lutarioriparius]
MALIINTRSSSLHSMVAAVFVVGLLVVSSSLFASAAWFPDYKKECNNVEYDCRDQRKSHLCHDSCRAKARSEGCNDFKSTCGDQDKPHECCCYMKIKT